MRVDFDGRALRLHTVSADETRLVGQMLGNLLRAGDAVLLSGDLGAGKTTLTQGVATGVGAPEPATSPTFVLVNQYHGRLPLYHADLYRLDDPAEVADLDLPGVSLDGALVVEWPERGADLLPASHLAIDLRHQPAADERELIVTARGERPERILQALAAALGSQPAPRHA